MSLDFRVPEGFQFGEFGASFKSLPNILSGQSSSLFPTFSPHIDPFTPILRNCIWNFGVDSLLNVSFFNGGTFRGEVVKVQIRKPVPIEYDLYQDAADNGSILGLLALGKSAAGLAREVLTSNEHGVEHISYRGGVEPRLGDVQSSHLDFTVHSTPIWAIPYRRRVSDKFHHRLSFLDKVGAVDISSSVSDFGYSILDNLSIALTRFSPLPVTVTALVGGRWRRVRVMSTSLSSSGSTITLSYTIQLTNWNIGQNMQSNQWVQRYSDITHVITALPYRRRQYEDGVFELLNPYVQLKTTVVNRDLSKGSGIPYYTSSWLNSIGTFTEEFFALGGITSEITSNPMDRVYFFVNSPYVPTRRARSGLGGHFSTNFLKICREELPHLIPSAFFSTSDAINKHIDVLKANHLENIASIAELRNLVPNFREFASFLIDLKNLRLLRAGTRLLDVLSSNQLKKDFGIDPLVKDSVELLSHVDTLVDRLASQSTFGERTLYGKFVFELPTGTFGLGTPILTARSKVRVRFDESSLLALIIGGEALGLLPTPSRLWDLIPFSFVVDKFLQIGDRLESIEDRALMLLLHCSFCVHSITIDDYFSDEFLTYHEIQSSLDMPPPSLRYYRRWVSGMFPPMRESKFDFLSSDSAISIPTYGSLLWQLAKD